MRPGPFHLPASADVHPVARALLGLAQPSLDSALALTTLNRLYGSLPRGDRRPFCDRALEALRVECVVDPDDERRVPVDGPLLVVANHPFGALDGLVLLALLTRRRPDVRVLANFLLAQIPDLRDVLIATDPFASRAAQSCNVRAMRTAQRWLRQGGALGLFPAGEVSSLHWGRRGICDARWSTSAGWLARTSGATVVPVFFEGTNSAFFHAAGLLHHRLRTVLLPRELLRRRSSEVRVRVGSPLSPARLAGSSDRDVTDCLRAHVDALGVRASGERSQAHRSSRPRAARLVDAVPPAVLGAEIAALPEAATLVRYDRFRVICASAPQIPGVLAEIGRLRELTFRAAGEGTGRAVDLDRFDEDAQHLFLWDEGGAAVVGAYRMAPTDEVIARRGVDGLYSATLFRYHARVIEGLVPALELGRSFVRLEAQRDYLPLMLLWKGIGCFVARAPRYRRLFGLVSISRDYAEVSRHLLCEHLRTTRAGLDASAWLEPREPVPPHPPRGWTPELATAARGGFEQVDALVAAVEGGRRPPPLLRHYLKLDARLLGLAVDPLFGHTLDALMVVDLLEVRANVLARYMGREHRDAFYRYHARAVAPCAARAS